MPRVARNQQRTNSQSTLISEGVPNYKQLTMRSDSPSSSTSYGEANRCESQRLSSGTLPFSTMLQINDLSDMTRGIETANPCSFSPLTYILKKVDVQAGVSYISCICVAPLLRHRFMLQARRLRKIEQFP
jgi:hypothetical protein